MKTVFLKIKLMCLVLLMVFSAGCMEYSSALWLQLGGSPAGEFTIDLSPSIPQRVKVGESIFFYTFIKDKKGSVSPNEWWYVTGGIGEVTGGFFKATSVGRGWVVVKVGGDTASCSVEVYE